MTMRTDEFLRSLPPTPLRQHIGQLHAILVYTRADHDPNAFEIAEHSLREIARFTMIEDRRYQPPAPLRPGARPLADLGKVLNESFAKFNEGIAQMRKSIEDKRTPEGIEYARNLRMRRGFAHERKIGLAFVKAEAARVRKELGL